MADDRVCEGYHVIKSKRIKDVEIVLAHNPKAPSPYVTWKSYAHRQFKEFAYGNYFGDRESAEKDFSRRVEELRQDYGLPPKPRKPPGHDDMARGHHDRNLDRVRRRQQL